MNDNYLYLLEQINKIVDVLLDINDYQGKNRAMIVALVQCLCNAGALNSRNIDYIKHAGFNDELEDRDK